MNSCSKSDLYFQLSSASLRRELLQKSQKDLVRECRKYNLSWIGGKGDIVDRLAAYLNPAHSKKDQPGKHGKTKHKRTSSSTVCVSPLPSSRPPSAKTLKPKTKHSTRPRSRSDATFIERKIPILDAQNIDDRPVELLIEPHPLQQSQSDSEYLLNQFISKLTDEKYETLRDALNRSDLEYEELGQMNRFTLKLLGVTQTEDQNYLFKELGETATTSSKYKSASSNTDKQKQYETEIRRLSRQLSKQKREYNELKKRYEKIQKKPRTTSTNNDLTMNKSRPSKALKSTWKSQNHLTTSASAKKSKSEKLRIVPQRPKMSRTASHGSETKKAKTKRKDKYKSDRDGDGDDEFDTDDCPQPSDAKRSSLRYDEGIGIKVKGLSALNLFIAEYEASKLEEKQKANDRNDFSLSDDDFDDVKVAEIDSVPSLHASNVHEENVNETEVVSATSASM